jgi:nucleoid-associated protein YgaU
MSRGKIYQMSYIKEKSFFNMKNILIALSLLIIITLIVFYFQKNSNTKELNINNTKIIVQKNIDKDITIKAGDYKKNEIKINGKVYTKYVYNVQKDDTLWKISLKFLNDAHAWQEIPKYNEEIKDPNWIQINQQIIVFIPKK